MGQEKSRDFLDQSGLVVFAISEVLVKQVLILYITQHGLKS